MSISRFLSLLAIGVGLVMQATGVAHAEHRVALVVGNSDYLNLGHLANPANDANLIANALKEDAFDVTLANNLDHDGLIKALEAFGRKAHDADWAVVYYAGRGIEIGETNYLVPIDAKLSAAHDIGSEVVPIDQILGAINGARSVRMVIFDASRDNPFPAATKPSSGLASVEAAQRTVVAYSTAAGGTVADGQGVNGPYATALAKHLTEPKLDIEKLFRLVAHDVIEATGSKQTPFLYAALPGKALYFRK